MVTLVVQGGMYGAAPCCMALVVTMVTQDPYTFCGQMMQGLCL